MIKYINNFGDLKVVPKIFSFNGGKEQDLVFNTNFNSNKLNNMNISQQNELLNSSDFNNMSNNLGISNTFDYKGNSSQNGRDKGRLNNQITKNKNYSHIKPIIHSDFKSDYMTQNNDYKSFKPFSFNK